jgi:hypothetical protein
MGAALSTAKHAFFIGFFAVIFFTGASFFGGDFDCVVSFATGAGADSGAAAPTLLTAWWLWRVRFPVPMSESGLGARDG